MIKPAGHDQVDNFQQRFAQRSRLIVVEARQLATHHQSDHAVVFDFIALELAGVLAVAQYHDAVGQFFHFAQAVADINDARPTRPQLANNTEQRLGFVQRQARRRFVHDEHAGAGAQRLGDFNQLLPSDRERAHQRARGDVQTHLGQPVGSFDANTPPVDEAPPARLAAEEDIRSRVQVIGQVQLLVDEHDAQLQSPLYRADFHAGTVDVDLALVGMLDAGQDLHERALARPIFAHQGQDFARRKLQAHAAQGCDARETLADATNFEQGRHGMQKRRAESGTVRIGPAWAPCPRLRGHASGPKTWPRKRGHGTRLLPPLAAYCPPPTSSCPRSNVSIRPRTVERFLS